MVPFPTIPPSEPFGWKDFFDSLSLPLGPIPPIRGKCHKVTKGVGKVARAKPVTDEWNAEGFRVFAPKAGTSFGSLV